MPFDSLQEKLGVVHGGDVYAVYDYEKCNDDELSFRSGDKLTVTRKGDENEVEWWWSKSCDAGGANEGYVPRNLLGLFPRVQPLLQHPSGYLTTIQEEGREGQRDEDDDAAMASN